MTLGSAWSRTWGEACRQQGLWHTEGMGWHHRDDLQEQQQDQLAALQWEAEREEAISSVRCLRCHYTPDACLCTWLIINRVRAAAGGGTQPGQPALCSVCCPKSSPAQAQPFLQQPPLTVTERQGSPWSRESHIPQNCCATSQGQHTFTITPLFSPLQTSDLCLFSLLLSSWLCHMQ